MAKPSSARPSSRGSSDGRATTRATRATRSQSREPVETTVNQQSASTNAQSNIAAGPKKRSGRKAKNVAPGTCRQRVSLAFRRDIVNRRWRRRHSSQPCKSTHYTRPSSINRPKNLRPFQQTCAHTAILQRCHIFSSCPASTDYL